MKKNELRKILLMTGLGVTLASSPLVAFASTSSNLTPGILQENYVQPRVKWSGAAYVSDAAWTNITSSNNLFADAPKVTNYANNPGSLSFRIINGSGEQVGTVKAANSGSSVTMDKIPAASGTYTLQAKATMNKSGNYTISID